MGGLLAMCLLEHNGVTVIMPAPIKAARDHGAKNGEAACGAV